MPFADVKARRFLKGKNIHGVGITPDEVVEFEPELYYNDGIDNQLEAAIAYLKQ